MIGQLTGQIAYKDGRYAILSAGGVGYKIYLTAETLKQTEIGQSVVFWTHLVVKEDALDLYGFSEKSELDFFELLIGISGVGPKSALSILSLAPPETLRKAVGAGNTGYLTQVSGIGRKIAEKIVLELRDKIVYLENEGDCLEQDAEAIMALQALGYTARDARDALKKVSNETADTEGKIREALKQLR